jgi:hypothetical protein
MSVKTERFLLKKAFVFKDCSGRDGNKTLALPNGEGYVFQPDLRCVRAQVCGQKASERSYGEEWLI